MNEATAWGKSVQRAHFTCKNNNEERSVTAVLITNNSSFITNLNNTMFQVNNPHQGVEFSSCSPTLSFHSGSTKETQPHLDLLHSIFLLHMGAAVIQNDCSGPQGSPLSQPARIGTLVAYLQ